MKNRIIELLHQYAQFHPQEGRIISQDWFENLADDIEESFQPKLKLVDDMTRAFIRFKAVEGISADEAIREAVSQCKIHELLDCDLEVNGYWFDISPELTDEEIKAKVAEYEHCKQLQHESRD